jgi:hypothetical protein
MASMGIKNRKIVVYPYESALKKIKSKTLKNDKCIARYEELT